MTELGKSQLDGKMRHLEAYDGNQLTLLGTLICEVEWNGSRLTQKQLAVVQSDKEFGLLGRDLLPKHGVNNIIIEHASTCCKGLQSSCEDDTRITANVLQSQMFCKDKVTEKLEEMVRQGNLELVQPRGVPNASPVVWQRKNTRELRLCEDLNVHIIGKVMDEDYPIPDMETIFHKLHGASYFGKIDLSDAYYKIELHNEAKDVCTNTTSQGLFKMCRLPQGLKISASIFQNCIESTLKRIKDVVNFQDDVLVYGTNKEQFDKRLPAVKSRLREKSFTINEKKSNSKPVDSVNVLRYSISKEEDHQIPNI